MAKAKVAQAWLKLPGLLFGLLQVGAHGGPGGEVSTGLGGQLTEQCRDGGQGSQGDDQLVPAALERVAAGSGEGVCGVGMC